MPSRQTLYMYETEFYKQSTFVPHFPPKKRSNIIASGICSGKTEHWKPKINESYRYISTWGYVTFSIWTNQSCDLFRFRTGNCHRTKKDAMIYKKKLLNLFK